MSREFIQERLFRPFDTTKGSKGMGIGAYQVREYVQSLGGRVEVQSAPGEGTRFTLRLPLPRPAAKCPDLNPFHKFRALTACIIRHCDRIQAAEPARRGRVAWLTTSRDC